MENIREDVGLEPLELVAVVDDGETDAHDSVQELGEVLFEYPLEAGNQSPADG